MHRLLWFNMEMLLKIYVIVNFLIFNYWAENFKYPSISR